MEPLGLLLILAPLIVASGGPLNAEENRNLQGICGQFAVPSPPLLYRSMNTPNATREEAPWAVAIRLLEKDREGRETTDGLCTGSLISPRHVVTAAHCVSADKCIRPGRQPLLRPLHTFVVMTTTHCQDGSGVASCDSTLPNGYIRVKKAYTSIYYADCKKPQMLGDVAVLELEEDVAFDDKIQPICLNSGHPAFGSNLTLFGYGHTVDRPYPSGGGVLRKLQTNIVSRKQCKKRNQRIQMDTLCSRHPKGFACTGDSGSGQVITKDGRAYLVGTLSGGVYCRVDLSPKEIMDYSGGTLMHNRWIAAVTGVNPGYPVSVEEKVLLAQEYREFHAKDTAPSSV